MLPPVTSSLTKAVSPGLLVTVSALSAVGLLGRVVFDTELIALERESRALLRSTFAGAEDDEEVSALEEDEELSAFVVSSFHSSTGAAVEDEVSAVLASPSAANTIALRTKIAEIATISARTAEMVFFIVNQSFSLFDL